MTRDSKETPLSRWSRRKLEAQQAEVEAAPPRAQDEPAGAAAETEQPVLTDADMPDIDSLSEASDFSPFMSPGVSDELRNLALRKLFRAPRFNIRDGLDEYDDDFTSFEKLGSIVTADMKHQIEMQRQKLRERLDGEGEVSSDEDDDEIEIIEDDARELSETAADTSTEDPATATLAENRAADPRQREKTADE